jgi:hypothetical protein
MGDHQIYAEEIRSLQEESVVFPESASEDPEDPYIGSFDEYSNPNRYQGKENFSSDDR